MSRSAGVAFVLLLSAPVAAQTSGGSLDFMRLPADIAYLCATKAVDLTVNGKKINVKPGETVITVFSRNEVTHSASEKSGQPKQLKFVGIMDGGNSAYSDGDMTFLANPLAMSLSGSFLLDGNLGDGKSMRTTFKGKCTEMPLKDVPGVLAEVVKAAKKAR